jgi:cytochrome c peroxidase
MAILGNTVYAAEYFSGTLGRVRLGSEEAPKVSSLNLGDEPKMDAARRGEMLFHDGTMCFQQWQSCASCHPGGRTDGLNWDLLNDGMGNPKNTKSLLLAHETPPAMVTGVRPRAEVAVRAGIKHIEMASRPEKDARAIDAYLKSMEPVPSPHLADGRLSASAKRGKKLFKQAGCVRCHGGPHFTDLKKYDVGTGTGRHEDTRFDVPSLVESWRTAPYLYDGRAATLKEVLREHNRKDRHGETSDLSEKQIEDLAEYVLSL